MDKELPKFYYTGDWGYSVPREENESIDDYKKRVKEYESLRKEMAGDTSTTPTTAPKKQYKKQDSSSDKKPNWKLCSEHDKWYNADQYDQCSICNQQS